MRKCNRRPCIEAKLQKHYIEKKAAAAAIAEAEALLVVVFTDLQTYPISERSGYSTAFGPEHEHQDSLQHTSGYIYKHSRPSSNSYLDEKKEDVG